MTEGNTTSLLRLVRTCLRRYIGYHVAVANGLDLVEACVFFERTVKAAENIIVEFHHFNRLNGIRKFTRYRQTEW